MVRVLQRPDPKQSSALGKLKDWGRYEAGAPDLTLGKLLSLGIAVGSVDLTIVKLLGL